MLKCASFTSMLLLAIGASAAAAQWEIDKAHSSIGFTVRHMVVAKVPGNFTEFDGAIEASEAADGELDFGMAKVTMTVKSASINTASTDRDKHLRGGDFFDAENHPELTFVSTQIVPLDGDKFQLIGDLTIRGVTKTVTFEGVFNGVINDPWGNTRAGFSAVGKINRQDFGVSWNKALDAGGVVVSDNVDIVIEIQAALAKTEVQG